MSNVSELMAGTIEKMKQTFDVNTIIGNPIITADGTTIIPITKMSIGIGSGGADIKPKSSSKNDYDGFGGGSGAGLTVTPIAFLVVNNGDVKIIPVTGSESSTVDKVVQLVPEVVNKISDMLDKKSNKANAENQE